LGVNLRSEEKISQFVEIRKRIWFGVGSLGAGGVYYIGIVSRVASA